MFRAAGPGVVSSAYWLNLVIYGDSELALIAFHKTSTRRKYKQVGGHGAALPNTSYLTIHCLKRCFQFYCKMFESNLSKSCRTQNREPKNKLLHRKCAVRIFIRESQDFRNEWVSVANEWVSKILQRVNKIRTKHFLWCNLFIIYIRPISCNKPSK